MRLPALVITLGAATLAALACRTPPADGRGDDAAPADLRSVAAAMYETYGTALSEGRREALPRFYHPDGALIVFNGARMRMSADELAKLYASSQWIQPAYFAWDSLEFDPVSNSQVIVTGGFRWMVPGQPDTLRLIYAALLAPSDSGLRIVFEHETLRPPR